jgi:hypothetical protein
MMRIGSATLNTATNSYAAITSTFDGTPTVSQFAGGSGGCWGWVLNDVAIGSGGGVAIGTYGVFWYNPYVCYTTTTPKQKDALYIRSGGAVNSISFNFSGNFNFQRLSGYTPRIIVDSNTKWTSDNGIFTMTFRESGAYNGIAFLGPNNDTTDEWAITALKKYGLKIVYENNTHPANWFYMSPGTAGAMCLRNVDFLNNSIYAESQTDFNSGFRLYLGDISQVNCRLVVDSCRITYAALNGTIPPVAKTYNNYGGGYQGYYNCEFVYNLTGVSDPGPIILLNGLHQYEIGIDVIGCSFTGYTPGLNIYSGSIGATNGVRCLIRVIDCTGLAMPTSGAGLTTTAAAADAYREIIYQSPNGEYRYESNRQTVEYRIAAAQPTNRATLTDGATPWSLKFYWYLDMFTLGKTGYLPDFQNLNRLANGVRTVTANFVAPSALTFGTSQLALTVSYLDTTGTVGVVRNETTNVVASSAEAWTNATGMTAYSMSITSSAAVRTNTMVTAKIKVLSNASTGAPSTLYFDPEVVIA